MMGKIGMGYACQQNEESSFKNISHLPSDFTPFRTLDFLKDIGPSKQELRFEIKFPKPHDAFKLTLKKITYGAAHQKPGHSKAIGNQETVTGPKELLEIQGRSFCKPNTLKNLKRTIACNNFIVHKAYSVPGMINKFIKRKGWNYTSARSHVPRVLNDHIKQKKHGKEDENDENGGKELD